MATMGHEVKTLSHAWREFRAKRSPRVLGAGIVLSLVARVIVGVPGWEDAAAAAAMAAIYPFGEWAIHVYLLHMPPFRFRGRTVYLATSKSHWAHHKQPKNLNMILLAPREAMALLGLAVPAAIALLGLPIWLLAGPIPAGAL